VSTFELHLILLNGSLRRLNRTARMHFREGAAILARRV
jgi:hypothetical protein